MGSPVLPADASPPTPAPPAPTPPSPAAPASTPAAPAPLPTEAPIAPAPDVTPAPATLRPAAAAPPSLSLPSLPAPPATPASPADPTPTPDPPTLAHAPAAPLSGSDEATPLLARASTPRISSLPQPSPTLTAATTEAPAQPPPLRWFFLGALVLSLAVSFSLALPLGTGAVLGHITERRVTAAIARLGRRETPALRAGLTGLFITSTLLLIILPVGLAVYVALHDLVRLVARIDWSELAHKAEVYSEPLLARLDSYGIELPIDQVKNKLTEFVTSNAGSIGTVLGAAASYTPEVLFNAAIMLLGWYVFAIDGRKARDQVLPLIFPWPRVLTILRETASEVIESVIIANILVSAVQAFVCLLPMLLLGVPRALVWGVLSFFLSFIPVVGTLPITLGAALWCATQGRTAGAVVMVIVAIVVGSVDNVLRPLFMRSEKADLSTLWLLVALTGGVSLFGLAGVIVGPLAFSLFTAFTQALSEAPGDDSKAP